MTDEPNNENTPEEVASERAGNGGIVPPVEHRFKSGPEWRGNAKGRPPLGTTLRERCNALGEKELSEVELLRISKDKRESIITRAAAVRLLRMAEDPDIADFAGLLRGENNLEDLRGMGVNTAAIKKFKQKTRKVPAGDGENFEEVIEREIELHDRSGVDFDRICSRTEGTPTPRVNESQDDAGPRTTSDGEAEADSLLDQLARLPLPAVVAPPVQTPG